MEPAMSTLSPAPGSELTFMERWQKIARRIRVPLGFVAAGFYLWQLWFHRPDWLPIALSLLLTLPGLWLRGYAAGYVKKNRELTQTGPYAHTRNPLYLGSILIAAGFAAALMSWPFALTLAIGFTVIYVPVIASEEAFLRRTFADFPAYCKRVPRLIPRLTPGLPSGAVPGEAGSFSFELYRKHREYNSSIGAALLYLSLLVAILLHSISKG
jgi:protein-S-isoprenylcysteine O-methyltransferase Ste14